MITSQTTMTPPQTPWQHEVSLPVGYLDPDTGTLHRQATLRKMTGREEALMADPKLRNNGGKLITALLANCVTSLEGVDSIDGEVIRHLFSADRNFLLLELRRLTFGDEMEANYRCPSCSGITTLWEDLSDIEVRTIEDGQVPEVTVTLKDGYAAAKGQWEHTFVFGLPTGEDEEASASRRDNNPSRQRDALLARCLKEVGDLEPKKIRAMGARILADLSMGDRRLIQQAIDEAAPGPDLTHLVSCDHCGREFRAALDMSHFFPLE
jgi:hypothetical protein